MAGPPATHQGRVMLVGSSILRMWESAESELAPLPVLNVAVNGSVTRDQLELVDPVVVPYRPKIIVYYCGSNDISYGAPPSEVCGNFVEFSRRVRSALPGVCVVYLSVIKCREKWGKFAAIDEVNAAAAAFCRETSNHTYVDINERLLEPDGETPNDDLFWDDLLHLLPDTYTAVVMPALKPVLQDLWEASPPAS